MIYINLGFPKTSTTNLQSNIYPNLNDIKYFGKFYKLIRRIVKGHEIFVSNYIYQKEVINSDRSAVIYNTVSDKILKKSLRKLSMIYLTLLLGLNK